MKPVVTAKPEEKKAAERVSEQLTKTNQAELDHLKKVATIKLGVGVAAFAFGAVTYAMLNKDFKDYKSKISNPEGLTSYAKPGIYISIGTAAVGLGVTVSSVLDFQKLKRKRN
jgi:peptide deformylase